MGRPILSYLTAAVLGTLSFGLGGGCAESESMLVIRGVIPVLPPECVVNADSELLLLSGSIDTRLATGYDAALQVANQLMSRGDPEQLRAETARVTITGAEVRLRTPNDSGIDNFTVVASGSIDPGVGAEPGRGVVYATLIPDILEYEDPPNPLVIEVQVYGTTVGGQDVWSSWYTFPLYFRDLVVYPSDAIDEASGQCTAGDGDEIPCIVGQDAAVPCSACLNHSFCLNPFS